MGKDSPEKLRCQLQIDSRHPQDSAHLLSEQVTSDRIPLPTSIRHLLLPDRLANPIQFLTDIRMLLPQLPEPPHRLDRILLATLLHKPTRRFFNEERGEEREEREH
jgi:hypothetical protein